jgi:hypothetical protein
LEQRFRCACQTSFCTWSTSCQISTLHRIHRQPFTPTFTRSWSGPSSHPKVQHKTPDGISLLAATRGTPPSTSENRSPESVIDSQCLPHLQERGVRVGRRAIHGAQRPSLCLLHQNPQSKSSYQPRHDHGVEHRPSLLKRLV